jgi:hypothetical protein
VILLVASSSHADACRRILDGEEVVSTSSAAAARDVLRDTVPALLVLGLDEIADARALFTELRDGAFGEAMVPVVFVGEGVSLDGLPSLALDEVVNAPYRDADLAAAVERAREVSAYREAVSDLYEESRERAESGEASPDDFEMPPPVQEAREEADDRLSCLLDRPEVVSSLLWGTDDRRTEG